MKKGAGILPFWSLFFLMNDDRIKMPEDPMAMEEDFMAAEEEPMAKEQDKDSYSSPTPRGRQVYDPPEGR